MLPLLADAFRVAPRTEPRREDPPPPRWQAPPHWQLPVRDLPGNQRL